MAGYPSRRFHVKRRCHKCKQWDMPHILYYDYCTITCQNCGYKRRATLSVDHMRELVQRKYPWYGVNPNKVIEVNQHVDLNKINDFIAGLE